MSRSATAILVTAWLAASAWLGYRLAERSFSWIDKPNFGLPEAVHAPQAPEIRAAQDARSLIKTLSPRQLACISKVLGPARTAAALSGDLPKLSSEETAASLDCIK